jgi:hypothetical protein
MPDRRACLREGAEAVKNRVAVMETPAPLLAHWLPTSSGAKTADGRVAMSTFCRKPDDAKGIPLDDQRTEICINSPENLYQRRRKPK